MDGVCERGSCEKAATRVVRGYRYCQEHGDGVASSYNEEGLYKSILMDRVTELEAENDKLNQRPDHDEVRDWVRDKARQADRIAELEAKLDEALALQKNLVALCMYCGEGVQISRGMPAAQASWIACEHNRVCPRNPILKERDEACEALRQIAAAVIDAGRGKLTYHPPTMGGVSGALGQQWKPGHLLLQDALNLPAVQVAMEQKPKED